MRTISSESVHFWLGDSESFYINILKIKDLNNLTQCIVSNVVTSANSENQMQKILPKCKKMFQVSVHQILKSTSETMNNFHCLENEYTAIVTYITDPQHGS